MCRWFRKGDSVGDIEAERHRLAAAKGELHHVRSQTPIVKHEVRQLRAERQRNGIGPLLGEIFRGGS